MKKTTIHYSASDCRGSYNRIVRHVGHLDLTTAQRIAERHAKKRGLTLCGIQNVFKNG